MEKKLFLIFSIGIIAICCGGEKKDQGETPEELAPKKAVEAPKAVEAKAAPSIGKGNVLLVTQSQFKANKEGEYVEPDAAVLLVLQPAGAGWAVERIEDRESNVFHKALQYGDQGILTLGANEAKLKLWNKKDGKWQAETLWHPTFGGKHNRLRDFELADFDGDGKDDLAVATHDQGVLAVVWRRGDKWEPEELERKANTFVHEIEVGDLDKDGKLEFYATPSQPNTVSGKDQGGKIVRFSWNGKKFVRTEVVSLETRHVKEILVTDLDGDGSKELYAALEAEVDGMTIKQPVEIQRFDLKNGKFEATKVATINDRFCRFLVAGDIDQDGKKELVAAAFSSGVWVIEHEQGTYNKTSIDSKSGGFEHAAYITDIDGDGKKELYVANDRGGVINRYTYENGKYTPKAIHSRKEPSQAMVWNITDAKL